MHSNHSQTEATGLVAHLERAKRLLGPNCPVHSGSGRWCVKTQLGAYLYETKAEAERSVVDPSGKYVRIFDIGEDTNWLEKMPDRHETAEERRERRAERERQRAAQAATAT